MKFNHLTINSNSCMEQDTEKIFKSESIEQENIKLFEKIMNCDKNGVEIVKGVYAKGILEKDAYAITLSTNDGLPLLETQGVICKERQNEIETSMKVLNEICFGKQKDLFKSFFGNASCNVKHNAPIIYDFLFPSISTRPDITDWTGSFCSSMGAIALEVMKEMSKQK